MDQPGNYSRRCNYFRAAALRLLRSVIKHGDKQEIYDLKVTLDPARPFDDFYLIRLLRDHDEAECARLLEQEEPAKTGEKFANYMRDHLKTAGLQLPDPA